MRSASCLVLLVSLCAPAQVLKTRPAESAAPTPAPPPAPATPAPVSIPLAVPAGAPLKIAVDQEVKIEKVGQPIHGKVVDPVYAFDKLVVPAGSEVVGKIAAIDPVSKKTRILDGMNANFSPFRQVHVEFDDLVLADGRHIPIHADISPASAGVLQFVSVKDKKEQSQVRGAISRQVAETKQEIHHQWENVKQQLHAPGKMHKLKRYAEAQLPVHPQYMNPGTAFNADLRQPLDFGTEALKPEMLSAIGTPPPKGSVVHALLTTPLNSATAKQGDEVDAVISQPLVVSDHLFLPQGSHLKGSVIQVRKARRLNRNGQLRIVFHQVAPPNGLEQKVEASLEGVEVSGNEHLALDSEGGAQVTTPKKNYLGMGLQVALAASSVGGGDHERGHVDSGGDPGGGAANGASGFRFLGAIAGAFAHNRAVASGFGVYGATMSVYSHLLARGHDVIYPKDMAMVIGLGTREGQSKTSPAATPVAQR